MIGRLLLIVAITLSPMVARERGPQRRTEEHASVVLVLAENPDPLIGDVVAPTLEEAREEISDLASLDPVCGAVPQVCELRAEDTTYYVFYSDGTSSTVYGEE